MKKLIYTVAALVLLTACRHDDEIFIPEEVNVSRPE